MWRRGRYRPESVCRSIENDRKGCTDPGQLIWILLNRELWVESFIDGDRKARVAARDVVAAA